MDVLPPEILAQIETYDGASENALKKLADFIKAHFDAEPPQDYLDFLRFSNGGQGIGPNLFVILDSSEDVPVRGLGYSEFLAGGLIVGGNGCGNVLGMDLRNKTEKDYFLADPICMVWNDKYSFSVHGSSFVELLINMDSYYAGLGEDEEAEDDS